jgi:spermidine/putrescine transport system substrate-binding protein
MPGLVIPALSLLAACGGGAQAEPAPTPPLLADELIFYDWAEDMPQTVLDAFTEEYGVTVTYLTYETQQEAIEKMRTGEVYDVVVFDNDFIPSLVAEGLLAEIDFRNVPNFDNISANFRDLAYDPGNKHSVPFNWGTAGLLIRRDLVDGPVTRWADLWERAFTGKIAVRDGHRELLGVALKALGYSLNSEDPRELEAALEHLLKIKPHIIFVEGYAEAVVPLLASGEVFALIGWADDALQAREAHEDIVYVLPEEGAMLWGDNFVIPANSPRKSTAEVFLNFLMRPEINAQIVNDNFYASPNAAARDFINPEILNDPVIFPPNEHLVNAEVVMPLKEEVDNLYQEMWERFKAARQ